MDSKTESEPVHAIAVFKVFAIQDDLGLPRRFDVYYGMADNRIGVARLDLPEHLMNGSGSMAPEK